MTAAEIIEALEKLRYQVSVLGATIDYKAHPVEALILSKNWNAQDLENVHDIFERWDHRLDAGEPMNKHKFESEFQTGLDISYQGLKPIVLAFYWNSQWTNVCEAYVDSFGGSPPVEYHPIMRRER